MENLHRTSKGRAVRVALFTLAAAALLGGTTLWSSVNVSANHPVLVEGNCDSPVPGTTIVEEGTCGDFDGDGRIGTAEDTDGADRIFGTLRAALGPGTGAAAGTGANHNGRIIIVASGRFAENLVIGNQGFIVGEGVAAPGNTTIEAAHGVEATIDAVLQGDPAGGNTTRQGGTGIAILFTSADRVTTLRNLVIRNWSNGITTTLNSRVHIDNCRLEGNLNFGIRVTDNTRVVISNTTVDSTGFRIPVTGPATPGDGIRVDATAQARIEHSNVSHSAGAGVMNLTGNAANVVVFKVGAYFNVAGDFAGNSVTPAPNSNFAF